MNFRLLLCIAMGVFVAHLGVFMLLAQIRPKPKFVPPPTPNFTTRERIVVDGETGEKTIYREITVSTKLAVDPGIPPPGTPAPIRPAVVPPSE